MARPWVLYNAQNKVITRLEGGPDGPTKVPAWLEEGIDAGLIKVQYRPRRRGPRREFPYEGTGRL